MGSIQEMYLEIESYLSYESKTGKLYWIQNTGRQSKVGLEAGCKVHKNGYIYIQFKNKQYAAHRLVWFLHYHKWPSKVLDHINGDKTDNRITNLREVSIRDNANNKYFHREGRLPGVSICPKTGKFRARIWVGGRDTYLGVFQTELEAHNRYLTARKACV